MDKNGFAELRDKTPMTNPQGKTPNSQLALHSSYATGVSLVLLGINNVAQE